MALWRTKGNTDSNSSNSSNKRKRKRQRQRQRQRKKQRRKRRRMRSAPFQKERPYGQPLKHSASRLLSSAAAGAHGPF
jgi:hypothetical protein